MGKSTINDIKNMYEIEEQNYHHDGIAYTIKISSISEEKLGKLGKLDKVFIWCDGKNVIQNMVLVLNRAKFDGIISYFSSIYQLIDCNPDKDRSAEIDLFAKFKDGDHKILLSAPKNKDELIIDYYAPIFMDRNYKPKK